MAFVTVNGYDVEHASSLIAYDNLYGEIQHQNGKGCIDTYTKPADIESVNSIDVMRILPYAPRFRKLGATNNGKFHNKTNEGGFNNAPQSTHYTIPVDLIYDEGVPITSSQIYSNPVSLKSLIMAQLVRAVGMSINIVTFAKQIEGFFRNGDNFDKGLTHDVGAIVADDISADEIANAVYNFDPAATGASANSPTSAFLALVPEPCIYDADGQRWFAEQIQKSGRVYIFGGGHVAQALVPVLAPLDFYTVVLENRLEFANRELFPEACDVRVIDFNNVLDAVSITSDDYVCIITRGHQEDILIQQQVLHSPARYIGLIGSAKKTAASFGVLRKMGFSEHDLSRIVTPIGISIGGRSPAEIAISIAAQLIQYRSGMRGNRTFGEMRVPL